MHRGIINIAIWSSVFVSVNIENSSASVEIAHSLSLLLPLFFIFF
jgi:hypothetical protein